MTSSHGPKQVKLNFYSQKIPRAPLPEPANANHGAEERESPHAPDTAVASETDAEETPTE